jgi:hypothetical protein
VSRANIWLTGRRGKLNVETLTREATLQYQNEWKALSNRIRGLTEALHQHAAILAVNSNDSFSVARKLLEHIWKIGHALRAFKDTFGDTLSQQAQEAIGTILNQTLNFQQACESVKHRMRGANVCGHQSSCLAHLKRR